MDIEVLGPGCAKCKATADLIARVAQETGRDVNIVKVEDMRQIVGYGVMTTPAVAVGGKVAHKGTVPSRDQVIEWIGA